MAEIIEYQVLTCPGYGALNNQMKEAIKDGWQPLGGVSSFSRVVNIVIGQTEAIYSQAIVKYKKILNTN